VTDSARTVFVGAHVSAAGGVENAPRNALEIGATAFSLFTRNQRRWEAPPLTEETITAFHEAMRETGYTADQAIPHSSYLVNLGSPDEDVREKSIVGLGGVLVLENTAGQGSAMGEHFSQLARIIEYSAMPERLAVCIDTCHAFAAGYDIRTREGWDAMMAELDATTGIDKLVALHLNDSTGGLGSKKDRHQPIGEGEIGPEGFRAIMDDRRLDGKPLILETPDTDRWAEEIRMLKEYAGIA